MYFPCTNIARGVPLSPPSRCAGLCPDSSTGGWLDDCTRPDVAREKGMGTEFGVDRVSGMDRELGIDRELGMNTELDVGSWPAIAK